MLNMDSNKDIITFTIKPAVGNTLKLTILVFILSPNPATESIIICTTLIIKIANGNIIIRFDNSSFLKITINNK